MKILQVVAEAPPIRSGVARVASTLTDGMIERGYHASTLSSVEISRLALGEVRLSSLIFHLPKLRRLLEDYDVINIHGPAPTFSDVFLLFAAALRHWKGHPARLVYTYHSEIEFTNVRVLCELYNWLHKKMTNLASHVIVSTPSYAALLQTHLKHKEQLSIIPWGVNSADSSAENLKAEDFRVIFVGQLRPYKGADVAIRAMQFLPHARLDIIGKGHAQERYRALVEELDLKNVTFHGSVGDEQLARLMQQAHVLVLPSLTKAEAFGIVLLEGMLAGCVPVASELPGVRDVVGRAGLTFPVNDARALAEVLERLQTNPALWARHSRFAREKAVVYPWQRTVDEYERVYTHQFITEQARQQATKKHLPLPIRLLDLLMLIRRHLQADGISLEKLVEPYSSDTRQLQVALKLGEVPVAGPAAHFVAFSKKPLLMPDDTAGTFLDEDGLDTSPSAGSEIAVAFGREHILRVWRRVALEESNRDWLAKLVAELAAQIV